MAKKKERSVITGNRWEAHLTASRQMVDVADRIKDPDHGPKVGTLSVLKREDLPALKEVAIGVRDALLAGTSPHIKAASEAGRFRGFVSAGPSGSIKDINEFTSVVDLNLEDLSELEELAETLYPMMEEFQAPWKN